MEQYYYSKLNKAGAAVYAAMLKGLTEMQKEFLIPAADMKDVRDIFFRLRLDHPEIFWATDFRCMYYQDSPNLIMVPEYIFKKNKVKDHQKAMTARVDKLVRPMQKMSDWEKEQYVHDFLCENIHYDKLKKPYSHEIIGPLGHGVGVCEGIAKSAKILLDAAGIWNIIVLCDNNPEKGIKYRHVWNVVRIDGKYYHMDATFDNTLTRNSTDGVRYDYFNLGDSQVFRDHEPLIVPAPECPDHDHFYYKVKKLSFTKKEDVYKRTLQYARKGKPLVFHWRGGYLTREILQELVDEIHRAAAEKDKSVRIAVNWAQAVIHLSFEAAGHPDEVVMEESNISEQDD